MVGCGLLKPDPVHARSDTPKRLKALCLKCCRFERYERPNFFTVSEPSCGRYSVYVCAYSLCVMRMHACTHSQTHINCKRVFVQRHTYLRTCVLTQHMHNITFSPLLLISPLFPSSPLPSHPISSPLPPLLPSASTSLIPSSPIHSVFPLPLPPLASPPLHLPLTDLPREHPP